MNRKTVDAATKAAKEFLARAKDYDARMAEDHYLGNVGTRESGALRRASMDLTRALAAMRRPQQ